MSSPFATTASYEADPRRDERADPRADSRSGPRSDEPVGSSWSIVIAAIAVVAAAAAVAMDAAPTGATAVDAVLRGALAAVLVVAATRAHPVTLLVGAALVAGGSIGWGLLVALAALIAIVVSFVSGRRWPMLDAVVGGVIGDAALDLRVGGFTGASALLAALAVVPILWSAYRSLPLGRRRPVRRVLWVVAGVGVVIVGVAAVTVVLARERFVEAIDEIEAGATALGQGDLSTARLTFGAAGADFDAASEHLDAWWLTPARGVPVLAQNLEVLQEVADTGSALSTTAFESAAEVDYDLLGGATGGIELGVLASFRDPLTRATTELRNASDAIERLDSPWIVAPLATRLDDVSVRVDELRSEAEIATLAVDGLPGLLGANGPRRYLILLGNPAEARDIGGHLGNWAEVVVTGGALSLVDVGRAPDLAFDTANPPGVDLSSFPSSLVETKPALFPQNWGADPDLPTVARLSAQLYEARTGHAIDGVMYADPSAFAEMVAITGPVAVPGLAYEIDATNAVDFLTREQYVLYPDANTGDLGVTQLVRDVIDRLTTTRLPGPRLLSDLFFPEVRGGHLQFVSLHSEDQPLITRVGLEGRVPEPDGTDVLAILSRNANQNKIDNFLDRESTVSVEWDPETGAVTETVTVRLTNRPSVLGGNRELVGNDAGLPAGTNLTDLAVLTPFALDRVTVDGAEVAAGTTLDGALRRHNVRVSLPPDGVSEVTYVLSGTVTEGDRYDLFLVGQPMVNPQETTVEIHAESGDIRPGTNLLVRGSDALSSIDGSTDTRVRAVVDR